ncbi:hypothetical protein [uncultured Kordia sp.]|uniref:hypothetical protein n=1 Tax=uncultured Kordia sp. TaxID=507699 RepID=UPI002614F1BE|nr:hypothetical protein [uncultured Kordia sp.]
MKKQKKLNLGKIKIAGINNVNSLFGGATTECQSTDTEPAEASCGCTQPHVNTCGPSTPADTCGTLQTVAETDRCTDTRAPNL